MKLSELNIGESAVIQSVEASGALRQHLLDMGLIQGCVVSVVKFAPFGDPMELRLRGYELSLRKDEASQIEIGTPYKTKEEETNQLQKKIVDHPGLGEDGKYHEKKSEHPLSDDTLLTFALAGNQNSGKTTLFNQLTGSNQHVGNFPGVTVDRKDGIIKNHPKTLITDLPGIYSMSPYTSEEIVTREFLLDEKPKGIINIVDATNIERNLYLTMQLIELDIPMVVALNMMDELRVNHGSVLVNELEHLLGVAVVPISAAKGEGIDELVDHAIHVAKYQEKPVRQDFCKEEGKDAPIHRCLHAIMHLIEDHAEENNIPLRFAASKLCEGDTLVKDKLHLSENEKETVDHIILQMEQETGMDHSSAIASMRFSFIEEVCSKTVIKPSQSKQSKTSENIDKVLTGKYTGIPIFIGVMGLVFYLTFNCIGAMLQNLLAEGIDALASVVDASLTSAGISPVLHSLIIDGIFNGVGSVLSFLPIIVTLFFFLSLLEDSGYIARVAFMMDKLLRHIGLSGRSIVPMLIGFGCSVPAVMSCRTLSSQRDRKMTVLLIPFASCSAKLPIYAFFANAFFKDKAAIAMISMYVLGILLAIVCALLMKNTAFKGDPVPFVMELPNYRMPSAKNVMQLLLEKAKDFVQKAFTIIFVATIVIWFLQTFDLSFNIVTDSSKSILAGIASNVAPLFHPVGFGDWRIVTALISGFMAKESVVSTLNILFGSGVIITSVLSVAGAISLLVFCLVYTPCIAAIASIKRELGVKWAIYVVIMQCVLAYILAFIAYHIFLMI